MTPTAIVLLGGPCDGERRFIPDRRPTLEVAIWNAVLVQPDDSAPMPVRTALYRDMDRFAMDGAWIYQYDGVT